MQPLQDRMVATGLATDTTADPAIAARAVALAMSRLSISHANSVLLFLSEAFTRDPQPALLAASRQSQCMQIAGCTALGIFTEADWVLDAPAAAAMVFSGELSLSTAHSPEADDLTLALAAPSALNRHWVQTPGQRIGGISGNPTGQGAHKVWNNGKINPAGRCELYLQGSTGVTGVSQGIRALTAPLVVTSSNGFDLLSLNLQPALNLLIRELPLEVREREHIPLHLIMAAEVNGASEGAFDEGRYRLIPVVAANPDDRSVTLASHLEEGQQMFWALRQPLAAERDTRVCLGRAAEALGSRPDFTIAVSSSTRGPGFFGGQDRDWEVARQLYPGTPMIGFYGNGEIANINGANQLLDHASVFGLFRYGPPYEPANTIQVISERS